MGSVKLRKLGIEPKASLTAILPNFAFTMDAVVPGAPESDPVFAGVVEQVRGQGEGGERMPQHQGLF